ncbi:MAG: protein-L-isoaspartate O-methyltransferase [Candidatus Falkowbacteria bacterium]|nr:protein-L-isoaspartate O-methyltransferase [Candidatus Falkowbacteria bacterium]
MQGHLIDDLIQQGFLKTPNIIKAFKKIKRTDFVLTEDYLRADEDAPLEIGYGQTISQPLTVAFMLELLEPQPGEKILDVGSGSGWTVALLAEIVGLKGKVFGLEIIPELAEYATTNVAKYNFIEEGRVKIICHNAYQGLPNEAPFDKIIVAAAAVSLPKELLNELKIGGHLVIPIGREMNMQEIVAIDKISLEQYRERRFPGFIFVPLVKG